MTTAVEEGSESRCAGPCASLARTSGDIVSGVRSQRNERRKICEASEFIPLELLGTTDDCGFSPFRDDISTARETAFAKIRSRVEGTLLSAGQLG
jgi:hypothetical protein